jgi:class 3 adenylate cyclase
MTATRRLTAILAADVAGYSRLMGADEEGTHERLKAHRRELVDPKISMHSGRIVKTTGDRMRRAGFLCCGGPWRRPARSVRSPATRRDSGAGRHAEMVRHRAPQGDLALRRDPSVRAPSIEAAHPDTLPATGARETIFCPHRGFH